MKAEKKILLTIFLCSFSGLAYEVALTRIFSVSLWYHFAFMIISIAMLGIGASGTVLSLSRRLRDPSKMGAYGLLLGLSIAISYLISNRIPFDPVRLSWDRTQICYILLYYITIALPFFFAGLLLATAFSSMSGRAGLIYGADLLGAGAGSIGVLCLMAVAAPERAVFFLSAVPLCGSMIMGRTRVRITAILLLSCSILLLVSLPSFTHIRISQYKGLESAMRYPGAEHLGTYFSPFSRIDALRSPAVRFAPGLSLRYLDPLPEQIGLSVDGGDVNAITAFKPRKEMMFLSFLPSAIPYEIGEKNDVAILDPKGGLQSLVAQYYDAKTIYKIESNPLIIDVIGKDYDEFSGGIYHDHTSAGLGRSWLRSSERRFDIIDMSVMGTVPSGSFGISEDYRFTTEAFTEYLSSLRPNGLLSISVYIIPPPRIELRILLTAVSSLEGMGVNDPREHVMALRSWGSICILVKRTPFTKDDIKILKRFSKEKRFDLVYYPGMRGEESNVYVRMATNEYYDAFQIILDHRSCAGFTERYLFDIKPVHDDAPFFHYQLRLKKFKEIYRLMGEKWQYFIEEGFILPAVLVQVLLLSLLLLGLPALSGDRSGSFQASGKGFLPYFAFLGIGYMFVEVSLIHMVILPLEQPPYAFATVLTSLLLSSGIGSVLSYRIVPLRGPYAILAVSALLVCTSLLLPPLSKAVGALPLILKVTTFFLILMPLGIFMGMPFPSGLRLIGERNEGLIPWAWAINGCLSVIAPILTIMAAMAAGFRVVLWIGASAYLIAFMMMKGRH
jgi:hypothetical protein